MNLLRLVSKGLSSVAAPAIILCTFCVAQHSDVSPQVQLPQRPLIMQAIDETQVTVLKGNTHVLARPQYDLGTAPATLPMQRMLLVLKRSADQESALRKLLDDQQDKHSPNYHKWLTPEQFGKQFGPTDADMQTITAWLQSHGFQVGASKGRTVLEFSGSASQIKEAFHTSIHSYMVNGEQHWANASDPSIPTALTPAVAGVLTLHNFLKKPQIQMSKETAQAKVRPGKTPALTFSDGSHGMAPADFSTIYNSNPALNGGINGNGVTIGVVGRSNLYNGGSDISDFRSSQAFNLCCGNFNIIVNGADPGDLGGGEEVEATLDSSWTGAVAPGANIDFVVSASTNTTDGIDLSETYIIENNLADIMTESFSGCEYGSTSAEATGTSELAEQAAAQGITYFVSTGDSGAEGCDDPNSETVATFPVSVNLLASTPFTIAVGGTVFNDITNPAVYWSSSNTRQQSALSYIPEDVWNDSCLASSCGADNANIAAGGGGSSIFFSKPSWQAGVTGILSDGHRDLPDVALSAAPHDGYVVCIEGSCVPNAQGEFFLSVVGGTSASTPSFAGIMALVESNQLNTSTSARQGQANYVFYSLAAAENSSLSQCNASSTSGLPGSTCVFHDVTVGDNAVPGEVNYGQADAQYQAGKGYDMATGLGSVNISNLVNAWSSAMFQPTTTSLTLNGGTAPFTIPHGTQVTVSITVTASSGTPAGDVSVVAAPTLPGPTAVPLFAGPSGPQVFALSGGALSASTEWLPGSTPPGTLLPVTAHYEGISTGVAATSFAASDSNTVIITVTPENSVTTLTGPFTQDQFGDWTVPVTTPQAFGTPIFVAAAVQGVSGVGIPTGMVTFKSSSGTIPNTTAVSLNSQGSASVQSNPALLTGPTTPFDAGSYNISASYAGDGSFNASSSTQPVNLTIQPGFFASIASNQAGIFISAPGSSGTTTMSVYYSTGFTGTVALACSGLPAGASCSFSPSSIKAPGASGATSSTITVATTAGSAVLRKPGILPPERWLAMGSFMFFSVIFFGASGRRRGPAFLLMLLTLVLFAPGCGGGGSKTQTTPPPVPATAAGTYTVSINATSGASTSKAQMLLVVQ